ncbi:MAG: DUF6311 domain-containing protein [Cyanobacteriota bacterium]|nr:DUF6311 domain-containing protein [Cyanobacteriota bacterium]
MTPSARRLSPGRWLFCALAFVAVAAWLTAWGPCAAPWQTACFTNGGWGDYKFHYQGWISYLHSAVWLPPTSRAFTWPHTSSVMFTDSVPLAAIVFKPLTRLLRLGDWQYFSLLSLANGLLVSGCCVAIGQARQWRPVATLALGTVLLTHALSWTRLIVSHESLQLQGVLLLGLTWLIQRRTTLRPWCLLCGASVGIHPYYTPMLLLLALVARIDGTAPPAGPQASLRHRAARIGGTVVALGLTLATAAWLFGFQAGSASSGSEVWGANGLALLDPQSHSAILPPLRKREPFEVEGFAYLGIGLAVGAVVVLAQGRDDRPDPHPLMPPLWWAAAGMLFVAALGPTWNIGDTPITPHNAMLALPGARAFYDIFRSAGRFTWPLVLTLVVWVVDGLARRRRQGLLLLITALQLVETSLPLLVKLGHNHAHRLRREGDHVRAWQRREPVLAAALARSTITLLGHVREPKVVPPAYAPQRLNPAIESNWGGEGITRLPRSSTEDSALRAWLGRMEERLARGAPALEPGERVLVISQDPDERARLTSLARRAGLKLSAVGSAALLLQP